MGKLETRVERLERRVPPEPPAFTDDELRDRLEALAFRGVIAFDGTAWSCGPAVQGDDDQRTLRIVGILNAASARRRQGVQPWA